MKPGAFMKSIAAYANRVTAEVLSLDVKLPREEAVPCPKCGGGHMVIRRRIAKCDSEKCGLAVYRRFLNKELTENHMRQLLGSGKTRLIKGFQGKAGKTFDARLAFDGNFNLTFKFPDDRPKTPKKAAERKSGLKAAGTTKQGTEPKPAPKAGAGTKGEPASAPKAGPKSMPKAKSKPEGASGSGSGQAE
jgi:DNA topoisomerase-3